MANNACDERSLVIDLYEKIPEGTKMREWFYTNLRKLDFPDFNTWLADLLRWRHILARRTKEPAMFGSEEEDQEDGQYEDETEPALRIGDARLAKSGLRGPKTDRRSAAEKEAQRSRSVQPVMVVIGPPRVPTGWPGT